MNQLNASLRTVFQDLVERRLWPVALALAIALVAIPVLLSSSASDTATAPPTPTPSAVPATGSASSLTAFQPVVSTEGSKSTEIKKNLSGFDSKDPFKVQNVPGAGTADASAVAGATAGDGTTTTGSGSTTTPGSGSGSGSGTGTTGTGQTGTLTYYDWTATVRFGIGDDLDKKRLERFRALPNSENPVVVFMDVTTDGESAVFLVSYATGTTGEGDCEPDDTCTFLYMKPGETQSFEAVGADDKVVTYKLKLVDIKMEKTDPPANTTKRQASTRAERRAKRAQRIARDRRDQGFADRIVAVGF